MRQALHALRLTGLCALLVAAAVAPLRGQDPAASEAERMARQTRRGVGLRAGIWSVDVATTDDVTRSPQFEGYYQRGLGRHLALENSFAVWRIKTSPTPPAPESPRIETRTYIAPLLTSLKFYPFTGPGAGFEPFVLGGLGFAFGVEDESESAVGGGGTTVVTGVALRAAIGVEMTIGGPLGVAAAGKFQWVYFGEELISTNTFSGVGVEGAVTYRFQF